MARHSEMSEMTLTLTPPQDAPVLLGGVVSVVAQEGDDAVLSSPLAPNSGLPTTILWTRGDDPLAGERFSSSTGRGAVTLTVRNATVEDSGRYSLTAQNNAGQTRSDLLLEVRTRPGDVPVFLRRLNDLAVKVGTRTRFLVEIRSPTQVKVSWEQEGTPIVEGERFHLLHEGSFFCVDLAPVTLEDAGLWMCRAHNASGTSTCFCHLSVLVPKAYKAPHFIEELVALLTEQGTVSLECKVVGVPTPTLKWFKDNQEIKAGDVFALSASPEDAASLGTYTCEATNCMGRSYSTSRVHIIGPDGKVQPVQSLIPRGPPPVFSKELQNGKVKIGGKLTLECKVKVPPWPKSVDWFNKEGQVESGGRYRVREDGLGACSMEVEAVEAGDEGPWKCVATSDAGVKGISNCNVTVSYPKNYKKPKFLESLKAILTEEGLVSFECKVVGYPTPQLRWFKDGQELKPGDVYQLTGTNSLGSYCCIAKNCMGQTSSSAELTVEDIQSQLSEEERLQLFSTNQPPRFHQGLKSIEAKIMDPLRFTVQVSVSPQPTVCWYRDEQEVLDSDRLKMEQETKGFCHLTIKRLELADQAEWKCVATNDYGQSVTSCFLKLAVPRHYKKPRFLENLRAVLSEEGAVNLECKVIGVPQPTLKWYKDGRELKPGDIHRIISGQDGTCCLGTYTCEASNCMGTVASSASLLGFEDRGQVKAPEPVRPLPPPSAHLARHPSLSTIQEERTSQMHDPVTLDERPEVSFSFDGKEVSVSLYETPDLTEEEALQVVEMYADELSEHISEHNVIELPPMRFVKETSTSGHLLMEAMVIDVSPEYFTSAEDRTEADLDEFSITEDNGFMSPLVLTPEEMPFDKFTADFLERSIQPIAVGQKPVPAKPPRKRGAADASESSYHSVKEAKISPEEDSSEHFIDALSSEKDKSPKEIILDMGFEAKEIKETVNIEHIESSLGAGQSGLEVGVLSTESNKKVSESKILSKKSRSRSKSIEAQPVEKVAVESQLSIDSGKKTQKGKLKKRKSSESEKEDDSLQEFEKRKSLKSIEKQNEQLQKKQTTKKPKSSESEKEDDSLQEYESRKILKQSESEFENSSKKTKYNKKGTSDSSGRDDDSLIEYERRKKSSEASSEKASQKLERPKGLLTKSVSTDSSEKDDAFAIKSDISDQAMRKKRKKSVKKSNLTDKKDQKVETGVEIPPSSEAESIDRESFKGKKGISTSDLDRMRSISDLESIGDKSRAQEEEDRSADFDTAEDSAYDKSEMSVLESLNHSIKEIQKGLAAVEGRVISESSEEPQSAKSSLSAIESLALPVKEIQRSLEEVERMAEETEAGQYSPSSILDTLRSPIEELGRNLAVIEQTKEVNSIEESLLTKTSLSLLETVGQPLQELQKELAFIQQQALIETGEEMYSEILQSFKPPLLVVQGGVEQSEREYSSKLDDLTDNTVIPQATYAQPVEENKHMTTGKVLLENESDSLVPLTVKDLEGSLDETLVSSSKLGDFALYNELQLYTSGLEACLLALKEKAQTATDNEIKDILISTSNLVTPLEQFKTVIERCLILVVENDKSTDPQVRSRNIVLKAALESPVHALGNSLHLLEAVCASKTDKEIRGLGIKVLYKLSFPLEELKTTMKLVENLSEHTCIELLVAPVENLLATLSVINPDASKVGFAENIYHEGVNVIKDIDCSVESLSSTLSSIPNTTQTIVSLSKLVKPLTELQKNFCKLENKIKSEENYNQITKSEILSLAQDLCKPLQAIRTELSLVQHEIELDQYSSLSLSAEPVEGTTPDSLLTAVHQSLEQVYKSVLTSTEFVLSKSPDESLHLRYLLYALNELVLPFNQLCSSVSKAKELEFVEAVKTSESNIGIKSVASSVNELLNALSALQQQSSSPLCQSESAIVKVVCEMTEPLAQVESGLCRIIGQVHEENKNILNINMVKTLAEPFKNLQKSLISISSKFDSEQFSEEIAQELRQPIQELQRSILVIQDQVSFEYGDEPATIESNIVTLQSLVQPLNVLKKYFLEMEQVILDQTQSTSYSGEDKKIHSIMKLTHELQLKVSSIMIKENYLSKHSLDSLDMFPIFHDLSSSLSDFEVSLKRVNLVCQGSPKSSLLVHNKLTETVNSFLVKVNDLQGRIVLLSNKTSRDRKHPVHVFKKGTEQFLNQLSENAGVMMTCDLNETSILIVNSLFFNNLSESINQLTDLITKMESVFKGKLSFAEAFDEDSFDMSIISSSDTIKDVTTIMEEVTQTRLSLESTDIPSSKLTPLVKVGHELQYFCDSLKIAEERIMENISTKASNLSIDNEEERRALIVEFSNMKLQLGKIETFVSESFEALESVKHLKYALEVIQEHLKYGEEISEVYILQNLSVPLKTFKEVISKESALYKATCSQTQKPDSVATYLEKFEKSTSDLELGLMKLEHALINSTGDFSSLKNMDVSVIAHPIEELVHYINVIEDQQSFLDASESLADQSSLSMLKTLALPIKEIQEGVLQIQEQIVLETSDQAPTGKTCAGILYEIAKPIRELRSGVALIQEQVLMEADLEPLSEDIAISSLQTLAAPVEELKKVLEGVIEQESVLFEPDLQSMSENMSILKTIAKPLKELQSKIASTEINQILEGNVQSFSVKDNMLALAKPVHDLQECIALVENQIAFEAIEGDISVQASISVLQKVAKPLLEVAKCIAIISEQNFVEAAESENHTIASDLTTLASETDVSFKSAVLNVHEPVILEQGISFVESAPHQKFADMTDERDLEKPVLGVQHGVVESVLESESSAVSEAEISEVNQARAVPKVNEEAYPSAGYLQQPLSMVETLSTNETLTMESADIKEVTENIALNNMVQEPLLSAFTLSADEQTLTEADIKDKTLNIAAHVEVQQPLSKGETLSIEDNLISTVGKEGVESNFLVQGQLQQSLADVESIETEEDTLESVSIQESSFNVEQIVGIQQTLSDVVSFTETEKTLQIAGVKNDLREPLQIETQQPMVVEGVLESFEKSSIIASVGETTPQLAANIQVQESLSNVEDLNISKEVSCIASFHDESILEGALQVEYQEALSNIESLTSEQHSEKQSQEICIEEPFNRIALQTEILKFMSVADEVQAIKEELTAKVSCEPALTELAHTEIQQVLAFAKDIESIKESLQAKSVEEPQLHMITQTDLIDVLNACESSVLVKELLTVKSVVIPPMQKVIETEMQQILSSCQSLQNIKQAITEQIKETKSDSRSDADDVQPQKDDLLGKENLTKPEKEQLEMIEENLEVAIKCKAELSEQSLETVSKHLFPSDEPQIDVDKGVQFVEQSSIQNELHEFISVAENISTITETLEAKFSTQPRLKVVVEQEIQQILHVAEEIQTIKENLKAKHVEEYPLLLATQIECQQVLIACEDMIAAKEALESKLAQDVSIKIALQPEMQLILASTNVLESFKQALAVRVVELNVEQNLEISQTLSDVTSLTESDQKFQVADIEGVVRESFAVSANLQEALSNVGDLSISKEVTGIASLQDQSLKEGVLQVEYQEVLTDLKSLSSEQYSEKQSQEILIEEPFNRIAVKTEILNFMSVADEVQAVKEELTAKVSQEPSLQKLVHTEIQQVLAFAKAIESIKESLQTKSVEEPQLHKITQTDLIDVLNACESSILVKELLEVKSVEMPPIQKVIKTEIQQILSSCQSLQNIKQVITEQIKEAESDSMTDVVEVQSGVDALGKENSTKPAKEQPEIVKENLEAAIKYKAELSEQSSQTYLKDNFPSVKLQTDDEKALTTVKQPSFQNELQDFVSVAENLSTITDKLQAKFSIEPRLKLAAQQEIQQLLHAAEEIQTIKESLKAKSVGESPLVRASQVEVQKVLAACEVIITAKEDLKSKSAKDVSIKTALHSELQDIFASTDTLANIKDTLTAHTIQFNLEQNIGIQQTLSHVTSFTETEKTLHVVGVGGDVRESFAASVQLQEALSNVGDLDILKEVTGIASLQDQSLKEGVLQVEYQEVLTDLKILSSEQYSDKQSQEILIEEPFNRIAVQTEILNFISVADEVQAVKEELTAKVSQEPSLQKLVHTEIQQVLAFAKAIESIKESLQTKSVEEPQLHKITQTDLIDVLNACESSILVKELLKVKSVEMPPIQKVIKTEIQQILSSCQSLQNIKQKITEQIKEAKSDSMSGVFEVQSGIDVLEKDNLTKHAKEKSDMVKENLEAAIKCKAQLSEQSSETDLTDKFPSVKPQTVDEKAISTVQQPFQNEVQEFISVAENMSTITEKLQAKFSTEPRLKLAAQQEFQQLLHAAEEIQTLKESFTAKHVGESPLLLATQLEVQQVLNACEDIITAKEALESKSTKDVSVKIALKSELNLISESTDILANIKQALTAHITQEDTLKVLAQTETVQIFTPVESLKEGSSDSQQANIKGFPLQTVSVLEVLPITSPEVKQMEAMCSNVDPESGVKPAQSEKDISQELSLQEDKSSQQIDDITKLKVEMLKANMQVFKQSLQKTPLHFASQEDVNLVLSAVQSLESVKEILTSKPIKELSLDVALESHIQQVLATTETLSIIVQDLKTSESSDPLFQGKINTEVKLILAATENINTVTYMLEETKTKQPKSHIAQSVLPELLNKTLQLESALEKIQEKVVQEDLVDAPSENKSVPNKELSNIQVDRKTIGKINELKKSTEIETEQLLKEEMKNEVDDAKAISAQETSIHDSKATSKSDTKSVQESSSHEENNIGLEIKIRDTKSASLESEKVEPDVETTIAKTSGQKLGQSTIEVDQKITGKVSSKTKKGAIGETEVVEKPSKTEEKDNVATTAIALKPGENLHAIENDKKIPEKVSGTNKKDRIEEKEIVGKVSKTEEKDNNATTASGENLEKSTMEDDTKIPKKAADKAKTDPIGKTDVIDKPSKTEEKDNIALAASDEKLEKTTIKDDKKITEKVSGKTKEDAIEKTKVIRKRSKTEEKDNIPTTESGEKLDKITVEDDKKITEKMSGKTKKDSIEKTEVVEKPSEVEEKDNLTASGEKLEKVTVEDDKKITEKVSGKTKEDAIEKTKVIRKRSKTEEKDNIPTTESGEKLDKITVEDDKEITEKMSGKTKKDSVEKTEVVEKPSKVEEKVKLTASGEKLEKVTIEDDKKITEKISGKTEKDATEKTEVVDEPRKAEEKENIVTKAISKKSGEKLEKNNIEDVKISEEVSSKNKKDDIDEKRIVEKVSKTAEQDTTVTVAVTKESGEELLEQSTVDNATKITKRGSSKSKKDARKKSEDFVRPIISKDEENKLAITKDFELGSEKPTITDTKKVTENVSSKSEKDTTRITETLEKNKSQKKKSIKSSKQVGQVESSDSSDKSELSESTKKLGSTEKLQAIGVIEKTKCKENDTSLLGKSIKKEASSIKDDLTSDSVVKEETKKEHFPDLDMQYKSEGTLLKSVESTRTYDSSRREDELKKKLYIDESTTSDYSSESISDSLKAKKSYSYDPRKGTDDSKSISDLTDNVLTSVRYAEEKYKVKSVTSYDESKIQHKQTEVKPQFCGRLVDRTAGLGTKVKVTCSLIGTPEPTVKWYKDGQPLSSDDLRVRPKLSGGLASLEISEASLQDSGRYTCVARNAHGETSTTATVKIFSYAESAPEAPKFTQQIRDHYKSTSDELVVECRVRGYPQPTVTWLKDGQQLPSRSRYQHSVLRDGTCRLTVHGPEPNDSGLYKCEAVNSVWTEQTSSFVMFEGREKYLADIRSHTESRLPRFTNIVTDHVVREGGTLALQVAVKGSPRADITWYRGSEPLPKKSSRFRYMEDAGVYSLIVSEAARSEAGLYTCRASNVHGYRDTSVKVEVVGQAARGKPAMFVSRPDTNLSLAVGEDITLSFRVSGDPKPKVTWMKGMKDITNNIRTLKETVNDYVRLTLKHATVVDAGTYFIMAKNVYGTDHAFVTVKLKQRARSLTPTGIRSLRSSADILRDVHESARALVKDVPGPITGEATVSDSGKNWVSLTWGKPEYRGAAPVLAYRVEAWLMGTEGGAQWVELGVTPINSFDAFFLKPGAEYKFRITARNRYGWGEPVTTAETITIGSGSGINFPPEILRDLPGPMKALEGDSITLECEVTGDPAPDIQWLRDGHDISKIAALQDRVTISDSQLTHRLILKGLTDEDSGRYVCEAANKAGRASTYARLLVVSDPRLLQADRKLKEGAGEDQESAPQFTMRLRDRRVQATYPVRLSCQAVGNPAPSISWTFNGTSVTNDDRHQLVSEADHFFTLEISRTQLDDGGLYTVTAQNCLSAVSCHCQLTVDKGIRAYIAPDFTSELSPTVTIKHGAELRLFAQVEAYPTVGIAWQRDGVRLRPSRRLVMNVDPEGRVELALASVTVKDAGLYTCTATNAVGRAETTSQVSVTGTPFQSARVPTVSSSSVPYTKEPRFVTKPRSSEAVEGDTVVIDCEVVGDPKPEVMWLRDWLKCTVARCPSRVQYTEGQRPESSPHNHLPDEVAVEMLHFRRELREAARQNLEMTPRGIFDAISIRFPRAAAGVGFPAVRSTIHRIRARNTPVVPRSLPHYGELLHSAEWAHLNVLLNDDARRPFFREVIGGVAEGWMAGVYVSARLADALAGTVRLHMDATFKVMPAGLHAYQLLTVHAEYMNYLFPVAFAVMTRKTQQAYLGVFHFIAAAIPTLSPAVIMTDFEPAMKNAAQIVWPTSLLRGCYFHYTQAVYRMHSVLRMREVMDANLEADWALHLLLALALLPADRVPIGLAVIRHYVDQHNLANQFRALLGYMDNFWLRTVGPETFSVYQQSHRTNNALEGFYSRLQEQMGPHPGVWLFHDRLRNIEQAQWLDLQRLMNGIRHVRPRRRAYMRQDVNIYEAQHLLTQGRYNEAQFLHRMAHCTKSLVATLRGHRGRRDALGVVADGAGAIQRRPAVPLMPPPIPIQPGPDGAAIHAAGAAQEDVQDVPLDPVPLPIAPEAPVDVVEDDNHVPDVRPPGTCVTCLVERATHCFFPCCHRCMCAACVGLLRQHYRAHICPCCRAPVDEILHIYDV